jgi:hypothetical protein
MSGHRLQTYASVDDADRGKIISRYVCFAFCHVFKLDFWNVEGVLDKSNESKRRDFERPKKYFFL